MGFDAICFVIICLTAERKNAGPRYHVKTISILYYRFSITIQLLSTNISSQIDFGIFNHTIETYNGRVTLTIRRYFRHFAIIYEPDFLSTDFSNE